MKKSLLVLLIMLLLSAPVFARIAEVDPYATSLTAEVNFWTPNLNGNEQFSFAGLPVTSWNYKNDLGAKTYFSPSVLVNYQFNNSGLTFTYDRLNVGGGAVLPTTKSGIPANTPISVSGNSNIFGLAYDFGSKHIWGSVGLKYFDSTNSVSGPPGIVPANFSMAYLTQPTESWFPFVGLGADIPVVPGRVDLYGKLEYSTPIIANFYDARIGLRANIIEGLNVDAGYRTMGWGSDLISTIAFTSLLTDCSGAVNYNGVYYGLSYYFY